MFQVQRSIVQPIIVSLLTLSLCGIALLTNAGAQEAPRDSGSLIKPPTIKPPTARAQNDNGRRVKVNKRRRRGRRRMRRRNTSPPPTSIHTTSTSREVQGVVSGSRDTTLINAVEPLPPPTTSPKPKSPISGGVLNGRAISMPLPPYPAIARAAHASGAVSVEVLIDEDGKVTEARALSGQPLLQRAAENAARNAKFAPTRLSGQPVKVLGVITYNFVIP